MSTIDRYTLEDAERNDMGYVFDNHAEAEAVAVREHLIVICNEYEFSDSYLVDDFTVSDDEDTEDQGE
jgi:tRNA G37 N-methylase TrmD